MYTYIHIYTYIYNYLYDSQLRYTQHTYQGILRTWAMRPCWFGFASSLLRSISPSSRTKGPVAADGSSTPQRTLEALVGSQDGTKTAPGGYKNSKRLDFHHRE